MFKINKKRGLLVALLSLVVASAAFAYWTTSGSGTGTGSVKTSNGTVSLAGTVAANDLAPGKTSTVTIKYSNSGASDLKIGAITGTVTVTGPSAYDVDTNPTGCKSSWFSFSGPTGLQQIAAGADQASGQNGSVTMTNSTTENQDACKGAPISIDLQAATATAGS